MAAQWHYEQNGQTFGPISAAALKQLADSGQLRQTDRVWKEGLTEWVAAGQLKGLFSAPMTDALAIAARSAPSVLPSCTEITPSPPPESITTPSKVQSSATMANLATEPASPWKSLNNGLVFGLVVAGVAHFWGLSFLGLYLFGASRLLLLAGIVAAGYFGLLHRWWHYGRKLFKELQASSAKADGTPAKLEAVDSLKTLKAAAESLRTTDGLRPPSPESVSRPPSSDAAESPLDVFESLKSEPQTSKPTARVANHKPVAIAAMCVIGLLGVSGVWKFGIGGRPAVPAKTSRGQGSQGLDESLQKLAEQEAIAAAEEARANYDQRRSEAVAVEKPVTSKRHPFGTSNVSQPFQSEKQPTISFASQERRREDANTSAAATESKNQASQVANTKNLEITISNKREELLQLRNELSLMLRE